MYLNLVQVAESFGVSERVVEGWIRDEGLPHTVESGRALFDRTQVARWAAAHGLATQAGFLAPQATHAFAAGCRIEPLLRAGGIWRDVLEHAVLDVFARVIAGLPGATPPIREFVCWRLRSDGGVTWAPVGGGFALPHPKGPVALGRDSGAVALLFLRDALPVTEPPADGVAITRLLFFVAPSPRTHLDLFWRLGRTLTRGPLREALVPSMADEHIFDAAAAADSQPPEAAATRVRP